jgi:hypothetical protein
LERRDAPFKWTKSLRADLASLVEDSARRLAITTSVNRIVEAFIAHDMIGGHDERQRQTEARRHRARDLTRANTTEEEGSKRTDQGAV